MSKIPQKVIYVETNDLLHSYNIDNQPVFRNIQAAVTIPRQTTQCIGGLVGHFFPIPEALFERLRASGNNGPYTLAQIVAASESELIAKLSRPLDGLSLKRRTKAALKRAGLIYPWQICELAETGHGDNRQIFKFWKGRIPGIGRALFSDLNTAFVEELKLPIDMRLSSSLFDKVSCHNCQASHSFFFLGEKP